MEIISIIDYVGTFAFAISGTLTAMERRFDPFGAAFIGLVTAVGGGTTRDLLIGSSPVIWIKQPEYLYLIIAGVFFTFIFRNLIARWRRALFLFDTVGIAVFTIIGINKALGFHIEPVPAILMGMVSAVVGGVLRDVFCNEVPLIFQKEIYATPCLGGGVLYLFLTYMNIPIEINTLITVVVIITIRTLSVIKHWSFPQININPHK